MDRSDREEVEWLIVICMSDRIAKQETEWYLFRSLEHVGPEEPPPHVRLLVGQALVRANILIAYIHVYTHVRKKVNDRNIIYCVRR